MFGHVSWCAGNSFTLPDAGAAAGDPEMWSKVPEKISKKSCFLLISRPFELAESSFWCQNARASLPEFMPPTMTGPDRLAGPNPRQSPEKITFLGIIRPFELVETSDWCQHVRTSLPEYLDPTKADPDRLAGPDRQIPNLAI